METLAIIAGCIVGVVMLLAIIFLFLVFFYLAIRFLKWCWRN